MTSCHFYEKFQQHIDMLWVVKRTVQSDEISIIFLRSLGKNFVVKAKVLWNVRSNINFSYDNRYLDSSYDLFYCSHKLSSRVAHIASIHVHTFHSTLCLRKPKINWLTLVDNRVQTFLTLFSYLTQHKTDVCTCRQLSSLSLARYDKVCNFSTTFNYQQTH